MTNIGPLTTTFTPIGPDCSSTFAARKGSSLWAQYGVGGDASSACLPSNFNDSEDYYYSPGICPLGYTSACSSRVFLPSRSTSETVVTCCPSGYLGNGNRGGQPFGCQSCFNGTQTFVVASGFNYLTDSDGVTTHTRIGSGTVSLWNTCVYAHAPIIRMVAGDIPGPAATSSAGGSTNASGSDGGASTSTATATGPDETGKRVDENVKQGSQIGVAAGVGIGAGLGTMLLSGTIVLLIRLYRKRLRSSQVPGHYKSERGSMASLTRRRREPEHQAFPYEMSAEREPGELSADRD
ncbi:hypothetical protein GGR58DRAFT_234794 [Xylaria digitata]|nr:hypothetical protein GGR58DRAFT_234794 [Xylaria digitata]